MKKVMLLFVTIHLLSGCLFFYRESYTLERSAGWVNKNTGESVPRGIYYPCFKSSALELKKKKGINMAKYENMSPEEFFESSPLDYGEFDEVYPFLGKCIYEKGYIFKINMSMLVYCYNYYEKCKAYKSYMSYW